MQSRTGRVAMLVGAVAVAVIAFVLLRPGDDEEPRSASAPVADEDRRASQRSGDDGDDGRPSRGDRDEDTRADAETPDFAEIEVEEGRVEGGPKTIEAEKGEVIRFQVESDIPDEIHVHGYEVTKRVSPGEPTRFAIPARLEGIYEVEAHDAGHVVIAELRVTP